MRERLFLRAQIVWAGLQRWGRAWGGAAGIASELEARRAAATLAVDGAPARAVNYATQIPRRGNKTPPGSPDTLIAYGGCIKSRAPLPPAWQPGRSLRDAAELPRRVCAYGVREGPLSLPGCDWRGIRRPFEIRVIRFGVAPSMASKVAMGPPGQIAPPPPPTPPHPPRYLKNTATMFRRID